jgi:hypothetical protein
MRAGGFCVASGFDSHGVIRAGQPKAAYRSQKSAGIL